MFGARLAILLPALALYPSAAAQSGGSPEFQLLYSFASPSPGQSPNCRLTQGTDGVLYGTARVGGAGGGGTVFRLNTDGSGFAVLKSFYLNPNGSGTSEGARPHGGVIQGTDGVLYGTTISGGIGVGTVFKLNPDGSGFAVLKTFDNFTTGAVLHSRLMQGMDGALYGTAAGGGSSNGGTVFKLNPDGSGFTVLKHFDGFGWECDHDCYSATGTRVSGRLEQGMDGVLYGNTTEGGSNGYGTLFKLNPDGSGFAVLLNFDGNSTGFDTHGGLRQGIDGALYGTAQGGAFGDGLVFKVNVDGSGFTVLKTFVSAASGALPLEWSTGLVQGPDGTLYGTAAVGGSGGGGTVFNLNPDGSGFTVLKSFNYQGPGYSTYGALPFAGLILGTDGALYGTTDWGGAGNAGTVFRLVLETPPVASAGADVSVDEGQWVELDGSGSGPNPAALTYSWMWIAGPLVTLSDPGAQRPTFLAPNVAQQGATITFQLTVTAGGQSATDYVDVHVVDVNHPPVADADDDQAVAEGSFPVTLHGEDSYDPDGDVLSYAWVQTGGIPVVLSDPAAEQPTFTAPYVGSGGAPGVVATLVFQLIVDDGFGGFAIDSVALDITNVNNAPIAAAGADQTVNENTTVGLNGTASGDPDRDSLSYTWTQVGGPPVALTGASLAMPSFTAPFVGSGGADCTFELTVDDGYGDFATDTVIVHVQNINDPPLAEAARPTIATLWPPNHGLVAVGITGVSDPDSNVTITITGVTQDEPTNGLGDGDTPIDAIINSNGTVLLRAERAGNGDGRVYHIHFIAWDLEGSVSGVVTARVPRDKKGLAMDGGELYDSTR